MWENQKGEKEKRRKEKRTKKKKKTAVNIGYLRSFHLSHPSKQRIPYNKNE